jgi:hypothetical protein
MIDDNNKYAGGTPIPEGNGTPSGRPIAPKKPNKTAPAKVVKYQNPTPKRERSPVDEDNKQRAARLALKEKEFQQRSSQLMQIEQLIQPFLKDTPLPETLEDIMIRADAALRMAAILKNPNAMVNAARLEAQLLGLLIERTEVGGVDEFSGANSREDLIAIASRRDPVMGRVLGAMLDLASRDPDEIEKTLRAIERREDD